MTQDLVAPRRKLTVIPLVAATYFMVSGGPYGLEELVQNSGYLLALVLLVATPVVWSLPTAMMVGELAAAIPAEGGFYVWVRRALGPFWGFQEAWLSLMASIFDMAVYPVLFVAYLGRFWPQANLAPLSFILAATVLAACVAWNLLGAKAVGDGSVLMSVLLISPFVVVTIMALMRHGPLGPAAPASGLVHSDLITGILVVMWNYMGWDNASTVAAEVEDPQRTYPRVMLFSMIAIVVSYTIPVAAVWHTHIAPANWNTGSWADIAAMVAGPWLGIALVVASMVSTFAIVNSLTMSYSRLPVAMAEDGYLPRLFTRKLPNGAPWAAIVLCALGWGLALNLKFDRLLMLDILLWGASVVLEFIALAVLRVREPNLARPFKIPGGLPVAVLAGVGPTALIVLAIIKTHDTRLGNFSALTVGLTLMAAGVAVYYPLAWLRQRHLAAN
ncbi:MAG TPA: APC family permease [Candidatus Saccharimonadales bacterium]|jgi:amino acid transporter|nr:APC family permease [Candidatus Saccharimonadales bacterium]